MPIADYVRDGIAVLLLLVSLARPWDSLHLGSQRAEVFALTVLSLITVALPYLARAGVLPASWTVHTTRRARLFGNAPYFALTFVYLVVDAVLGGPNGAGGGLGTGMALGLAGAILAAQARECELGQHNSESLSGRRWVAVAIIVGGLTAAVALANVIIVLITFDADAAFLVSAILGALVVIALVTIPLIGVIRGSAGARAVAIAVGAVFAAAFLVGSGTVSASQVESLHLVSATLWFEIVSGALIPFAGLLFVPAVMALVAAPVTRTGLRPVAPAQMWIAAAVRAFDLIAVIAGFLVVVTALGLFDGDIDIPEILSLVAAVAMAAFAVMGRIVLAGGGERSRTTVLILAACTAVAGGLLLGALAVFLGSGALHLVAAIGLPGFVIGALTVPDSVRALYPPMPRAYVWEPPAPKPVRVAPQPAPYGQQSGYPQQQGPGAAGYGPAPQGYGAPQQGYGGTAPSPVYNQQAAPEAAPYASTGGAPTEAMSHGRTYASPSTAAPEPTEQMPAVGYSEPSGSAAQPPEFVPAQQGPAVPATQQVAGFTAEQAFDPSTPLEVLAQIVQDAPHLRAQVAANPSTYPALLEWLGSLNDPAVNEALRSRR